MRIVIVCGVWYMGCGNFYRGELGDVMFRECRGEVGFYEGIKLEVVFWDVF